MTSPLMRGNLTAAAIACVLLACSSSSDKSAAGGGGGASGQSELSDGTVGSSCSGTCQGDLQCLQDASIPNGYCTKTCSSDQECSALGRCAQTQSGGVCFRVCSSDGECRPGYACKSAGTYSVCDVGTPQGTGGSGGSPPSADCSTVAVPAQVSGGCNISLVTPTVCEEIDLTNGKAYEFAWTTGGTMCETPFYLIISGNPATEQNAYQWSLSDGANNGLIHNNSGGVWYVTAADLAGLTSDNGIYHWLVAGYYGSHPNSQTFRIKQ